LREHEIAPHILVENEERKKKMGWILQKRYFEDRKTEREGDMYGI
jgi:hypothetical protein